MNNLCVLFSALLIGLAAILPCHAEILEVTAEGEYVMGAGETMAVAEERAMRKAEQNAAEQAGVFVKSYSQVRHFNLAEDVIEVIANHAMKVSVLDKKKTIIGNLEAIRFQIRIKAVMTTEDVDDNLKKVREDRGLVDAYNRLKADYDWQAGEMEILKKRLTETAGEEKKHILAKISNEEKRFKANLWLEKAKDRGGYGYETSLNAYNKAIELNPALAVAYVGRAGIYSLIHGVGGCDARLDKGQTQCPEELEGQNKALSDVNKALEIDKNDSEAYSVRAVITSRIRDIEWRVANNRSEAYEVLKRIKQKHNARILDDINRAIALKPDNPAFYEQRASYYDPVDENDKRIVDMTRAIALCKETECGRLALYYMQRADFYDIADRKDLAEQDRALSNEAWPWKRKAPEGELESGELLKLKAEIYPGLSWGQGDQKREKEFEEINRRIAQKKGTAEDYLTRADRGEDQDSLRDYSEAIRRLRERGEAGKDALMMTRAYLSKAMLQHRDKRYDEALNELHEAQAIIDKNLPLSLRMLKPDDFKAILSGGAKEKAAKWSRAEAEAFFWIVSATEMRNNRAAVYEELALPAKAGSDYQYLCRELKDDKACKEVERLK